MEKESFRILVVDDDLRLRDLLKRYLGEQGFNVKTVSDAAQMDRALLREHFKLEPGGKGSNQAVAAAKASR